MKTEFYFPQTPPPPMPSLEALLESYSLFLMAVFGHFEEL